MAKDKSIRQIAEEMKISKSVVGATIKKMKAKETSTSLNVNETIPTNLVEEDSMSLISSKKADAFLSALAPSVNAPPPNPKEMARRDAVINNLLNVQKGDDGQEPTKATRISKKRAYNKKQPAAYNSAELGAFGEGGSSGSTENKASLISRITLNVNTFEPILKDFIKPNKDAYLTSMTKKGEQELEIILKTLEHSRSVFNISTQLRSFVYMGSSAIEYGTQRFMKMKTEGFAQALMMQDQEIRMCLAEYCMDKVETFQKVTRPEAKLASIIVLTLLSVDAKNRMMGANPPANQELKQEVAEEYKDL